MEAPVLICESDSFVIQRLQTGLDQTRKWEFANNGKDAQLKLYKQRFSVVVLDLDLQAHSAIEVFRYIKATHPYLRLVLVASSQSQLDGLGFTKKEMERLGVVRSLIKPLATKAVDALIQELHQSSSWRNVIESNSAIDSGKEFQIADNKFTRIKLTDFFDGEVAVFDVYLRLNPNKYVKVFGRGELYDKARLKTYQEKGSAEWLYFLTADRALFLNYLNDFTATALKASSVSTEQKLELVHSVSDQYVQEIHTRGIRSDTLEEGKKLCDNVFSLVKGNTHISDFLRNLEQLDTAAFSDSFLTAFFSAMITAQLPWGTKGTIEKVVMGALLADIGKLKLPAHLREKAPEKLTPTELTAYRLHPRYGVEMLDASGKIHEAVKQIVYQHHEYVNGAGFPNGLTGLKIFPPAKIVAFASDFVVFLRTEPAGPLTAIKAFLRIPGAIEKYDPAVVRAFLTCFVSPEKAKKLKEGK